MSETLGLEKFVFVAVNLFYTPSPGPASKPCIHLRFHFDSEYLSGNTHRKCCTVLLEHATRAVGLRRAVTGTVSPLYLGTQFKRGRVMEENEGRKEGRKRRDRRRIVFVLVFNVPPSLILDPTT